MKSRLPESGINKFQRIKAMTDEAEKDIEIIKLSIGQPSGPAFLSARKVASETILSDSEAVHEYQDNGSPGAPGFAERFIQAHFAGLPLQDYNLGYLPTPGNKPMLGLSILACNLQPGERVMTTTDLGYPTPADQAGYLKVRHSALPTNYENSFRFDVKNIKPDTSYLMTNFPHNPSGQIATKEWWRLLCEFCEANEIRLLNDNPYYLLSFTSESSALTEIAIDYPNLSWVELFSASKIIGNGTGWRIGAMVGSLDFIKDIATIKSNTDSGFVASNAAGVLHAIENDMKSIEKSREMYRKRIEILINTLESCGMRLAIRPRAGFFTLWRTPDEAFGKMISSADEFNLLMIKNTGVVGVDFDRYMRYSVTGDIEAYVPDIREAFAMADVSYY